MKKSIEMKLSPYGPGWDIAGKGACFFCASELTSLLDIPPNKTMFMMLSDKKPNHSHYWTIKRPDQIRRSCFVEHTGNEGGVGVTNYATDNYMAEAYRQGYRYVWAEVWA